MHILQSREELPITYYYNNNKIFNHINKHNGYYNGVSEYLLNKRKTEDIDKEVYPYTKIHIDEEIENNHFIKKEISFFKYKIFSIEAINIIEKWYEKYLNIFNNYNCTFSLSAGLDSRVLLSFLIKLNKKAYIYNYHRTTTFYKADDDYDLKFIDIICSKYKNLKKINFEHNKKHINVGGHYSEWFRDKRVFKDKKFIEYCYLTRKDKKIYPMIDKDLVQIDPVIPDLLSVYIINKYAPELLDYDFQTGNSIYTKKELPIKYLRLFKNNLGK